MFDNRSIPRDIPRHFVESIWLALFLLLASLLAGGPLRAATAAEEKREQPSHSLHGEAKPEKPASPDPAADEKAPVTVSGQVAEDSAGPHGVIRFWLTIENRSARPISNIRLTQPRIEGFQLTRLCWPGERENHCPNVQKEDSPGDTAEHDSRSAVPSGSLIDLQSSLAPQESVTVWGYLEAIATERKQIAFLTVSWDGPGHSSKTIGIGEIESLSVARAFFLFFTNNWEWTFPILIPALTFLGSRWLKYREGKRKAKAEELGQRQRTWSLMLKQAQTIGLKYYTPLSGSVQLLRDEIETYGAARAAAAKDPHNAPDPDGVLLEACYDLLMQQRRLRETLDVVGGYYFKNRDGEFLADALYQKHRSLLDFSSELRQMFSAAGLEMKVTSTWAEFLVQVNTPRNPIHLFWQGFRRHMAKIPEDVLHEEVRILDAYAALLNYEVNRPLLYWYGKLRPIQFKYTEGSKSSHQILHWKDKQEKLHLSDSQVAEYQLAGKNYLEDVEREVSVIPEKKRWWLLWLW